MRVAIDSHKVFGCQAMRVDESQSDNIVVFRHWLLHFDLMSEHDIHYNELVCAEKETIPFREGLITNNIYVYADAGEVVKKQ